MLLQSHFVGIDVSKLTLDVFLRTNQQHFTTTNNAAGFAQLVSRLQTASIEVGDTLFCFENTGMYSRKLAQWLTDKELAFVEAHPLDVKLSGGASRGKNDKTDAIRLATYAWRKREELTLTQAASPATERLRLLKAVRQQLVKSRTALKTSQGEYQNVLGLKADDVLVVAQQAVITTLNQQIVVIEKEIRKVIDSCAALQHNYKLLLSVPGVGEVVATALLFYTDNFSRFATARKFASYCGLVPYEHSSGTSVKRQRQTSPLANKEMKALLDRGATSVIEHDADMKAYYQRKIAEGKAPRSVINAVRCKLVYRIFTVIKEQRPYVKDWNNYQQTLKKAA